MDATQYIFINKGARMSSGKIAAQAGHAAVESFLISGDDHSVPYGDVDQPIIEEWRKGGHYKKIVLEARDGEHLMVIDRYLRDRGFRTALIIDEGHTEVPPLTPTALGVEILDKDREDVQATFSSFGLYRSPRPPEADIPDSPALDWPKIVKKAAEDAAALDASPLKPVLDYILRQQKH